MAGGTALNHMAEFPTNTANGLHRVAITGAGIITSMGNGWKPNAMGFREGRMALRKITLFDASRQRVDRAGEVEMPDALPENLLGNPSKRRIERGSELLLHAALEAWSHAGLSLGEWRGHEVAIALGTSAGAMAVGEAYYKQAVNEPENRKGQATRVRQYQIQSQGMLLAEALGVRGPMTIISNACASGANCIGHAFEQLRFGRVQTAIAAGYDALSEMVFAGFDSLQALSTTVPRPFDAHRDGLAIGEGAGAFVLETFEHAQARGATILAEVCGYGAATDLHHLTQPHPDGDAALTSMTLACRSSGLKPEQLNYINSHGTGTPLNDVAEARAIVRWAGEEVAKTISVSSTKSAIGHLLGGAGAVEAVICLMALREGWLPPTTTIRTLDDACKFDVVIEPRDRDLNYVLTNSFGFGGANATVILGKPELNTPGGGITLPEKTEIAITGIGAVSGVGWGAEQINASAEMAIQHSTRAEGALGMHLISVPSPAAPPSFLRDPRLRRVSPISKFAVAASLEALGESRIAAVKAGELKIGVIFSILNGCVNYSRRFYAEALADPKTASPILFPETVFNAPSSHLSALLGSREINYTLIGDHAGFLPSMKIASQWLEEGRVDGVLVVSAEELDWLSAEAAMLYDPNLVISEGGAAVYLERQSSANQHSVFIESGPHSELYEPGVSHHVTLANILNSISPADKICTGVTGSAQTDQLEHRALLNNTSPRLEPLRHLGHGMGVATGWQVVAAVKSLQSSAGESDSIVISAMGASQQAGAMRLVRK